MGSIASPNCFLWYTHNTANSYFACLAGNKQQSPSPSLLANGKKTPALLSIPSCTSTYNDEGWWRGASKQKRVGGDIIQLFPEVFQELM